MNVSVYTEKKVMAERKQKNYLQKGDSIQDTVHSIDYLILDKLGEGGEGVVYKAAVTIDISGSREGLKNGDIVCIKETNRETTRTEAAVLKACQGDPSIVKLYSTFEKENSEYIVEEYIDGITLRNYVTSPSREKLSVQDAANTLYPVAKAVKGMHHKGYLHCDISPDNLIFDTKKRQLVLIDFGFAHNIDNKSPLPQKPIYSPTEFYEDEAYYNSDLYSFCAVMYFCIMGKDPESVTSRSIFDELKRPSEIGIDIKEPMESLLIDKGMALFHEDRLDSFDTLLADMSKYYPEQTPQWKVRQQKKRRTILAASAVILLAAGLFIYLFRTQLYFQFIETQVIALDGSAMTEEEFNDSLPKVKSRLEAFAGKGKYLWKQNQDQITFEVPIELFGETAPEIVTRYAITRPMRITVKMKSEDNDEWQDICPISQTEDIAYVNKHEDGIIIAFSDAGIKKMGGLLNEDGRTVSFWFDEDLHLSSTAYYEASTIGDGKSVAILPGGINVPDELITMHFTKEPSAAPFGVNREWNISWENPSNALIRGNNQVFERTITGEALLYRFKKMSSTTSDSGFSSGELSAMAIIKNRLDSLDVPYAIGHDRFTPDCIIVKIPGHSLWQEEINSLCDVIDIRIGSKHKESYLCHSFTSVETVIKDDGSYQIVVTPASYEKDDAKKIIQTVLSQGTGDIGLYLDNKLVALGGAENNLKAMDNNGSLVFDRWNREDSTISIENKHYADFICACAKQNPQFTYKFDAQHIQNEKGNADLFESENIGLENGFVDKAIKYVTQWKEKGTFGDKWSYFSDTKYAYVNIENSDLLHPEKMCKSMEDWLNENDEIINSGIIDTINVSFYENDSLTSVNYASLNFVMDFEQGKMIIDYARTFSSDQEMKENMAEIFNSYFHNSETIKRYIPDTLDGKVFKASDY